MQSILGSKHLNSSNIQFGWFLPIEVSLTVWCFHFSSSPSLFLSTQLKPFMIFRRRVFSDLIILSLGPVYMPEGCMVKGSLISHMQTMETLCPPVLMKLFLSKRGSAQTVAPLQRSSSILKDCISQRRDYE